MKETKSNVGIYVENTIDKATINEVCNSLLKLLACQQEQETIRFALDIFGKYCGRPTNITGCNITLGGGKDETV